MTEPMIFSRKNISTWLDAPSNQTSINAASNASKPNSVMESVNGAEKQDNKGLVKSGNTVYTLDSLYQSVSAILGKYKISVTEAKNSKLLEGIAGCTSKDLEKKDAKEIENIKTALQAGLEDAADKGGKISLQEVIKIANGYKVAIEGEWTVEGLRKRRDKYGKESFNARIERFMKDEKIEDKNEAYEKFFKDLFDSRKMFLVERAKHPLWSKEQIQEEVNKRQIQTFARIVADTDNIEERKTMLAVLQHLTKNPAANKAYYILNNSFVNEGDRTDFNNNCAANEDFDNYIDNLEKEDAKDISTQVTKQQDYEHKEIGNKHNIKKAAALMTEENKAKLEAIQNKIANNEKLTEEEQELWNRYQNLIGQTTGREIGIAISTNIDETQKTTLLEDFNSGLQEHETLYKDTMIDIKETVESNPEILSDTTVEKFESLLNKTTNDNYTIVNNDKQAQLNPPVVEQTTNNTQADVQTPVKVSNESKTEVPSTQTEYGYSNQVNQEKVEVIKASISTKKEQLTDNKDSETSLPIGSKQAVRDALKEGVIGFTEYAREAGLSTVKQIKLIFNEISNMSNTLIEKGCEMFKSLNLSTQELTFAGIHKASASKEIINNAMDERLVAQLKGKSFFEQQIIDEKKEEIEERDRRFGLA